MKSDDLRRAIGSIDEDLIESADKTEDSVSGKERFFRGSTIRRTALAAAAAALVLIGALTMPSLLKHDPKPASPGTSEPEDPGTSLPEDPGTSEQDPEPEKPLSAPELRSREDFDRIAWSAENEPAYLANDSVEVVEWNGISVSKNLYEGLQAASDGDPFAVAVKAKPSFPKSFDEFVYQGKSGRQISEELNKTYEPLWTYEELEMGAFGTDEEKAAFNSYYKTDIIQTYGLDFLEHYYKDGVFDEERIRSEKADLDAVIRAQEAYYNEAWGQYARAAFPGLYQFHYYLGTPYYSFYHEESDQHYQIAVITKADLASLRADYDASDKTDGGFRAEFDFENDYFALVSCPPKKDTIG